MDFTIPAILDKVTCFLGGHDYDDDGVCTNCGAKK